MSDSVFLLDENGARPGAAAELPARRVSSSDEVAAAFSSGRGSRYWIARRVTPLLTALAGGREPDGDHFLVVLEAVNAVRQAVLDAAFRRVLVQDGEVHLLPLEELAEVLASPRREELFIGGVVNRQDRVVVLYRGTLEPLLVPADWFTPSPNGTAPDFEDFEVTDFGQTVRFGDYEATGEAILYEHDAEYRRRARKRLRDTDRSFGACLRRLRLQKGVDRDDFPGVSEKQIARIERGETGRPRASTLAAIAGRLGVRPEEIEEY
ncbi:MAG TPA: helix-turn-helix domain-containing protein [Longimicrobium sp.]|nr:helix-turn-helix domain-containing protein [Longimicrobium sp.]